MVHTHAHTPQAYKLYTYNITIAAHTHKHIPKKGSEQTVLPKMSAAAQNSPAHIYTLTHTHTHNQFYIQRECFKRLQLCCCYHDEEREREKERKREKMAQ